MYITIKHRHTVGTDFLDCSNCALCKAAREQMKISEYVNASPDGLSFDINGNRLHFTLAKQFGCEEFAKLKTGRIQEFLVEIIPHNEAAKAYIKELTKDNSITPKTEFSPVTFSEIKETILLSNS